jgi:hypothetical protein
MRGDPHVAVVEKRLSNAIIGTHPQNSTFDSGSNVRYTDESRPDKATADVLDAILRMESRFESNMTELKHISGKVDRLEKVLISTVPHAEASLKEEMEPVRHVLPYTRPPVLSEPHPLTNESPYSNATPGQQTTPSQQKLPREPPVEGDDEEEAGDPVPPGQPSIPVNHTTGAARLLLVGPIAEMARGIVETEKIKNEKYPMIQEERRGLLRLFGRGEGLDRPPGYEKDPMTDHTSDSTPSETSSDVSSPAGEEWGQLGGLTPPGNEHYSRGGINPEGMPPFDPTTVWDLVQSYKENINIMHPILIPKRLDALVEAFLKSIPDGHPKPRQISTLVANSGSVSAGFLGGHSHPESPGQKRKRSPAADYSDPQGFWDHKPGHPYRSISTALVLLVLALGKISLTRGKIPEIPSDRESSESWGSPTVRNGLPLSPLQSSPSMSTPAGLPSPYDSDRIPRSRRSSMEGQFVPGRTGLKPKNLDILPGLAYFALATDIIGNQVGGNSLQHVHVNILAGLYHGQLARVLESHAYIHQACRSLQVILRP